MFTFLKKAAKKTFFVSAIWGVTMSVYAADPANADKELQNAQAATIMINHVNWVVNRIKSTNDLGLLELEYEGISLNKLNLQSIKDVETIDQITAICNFITERRISEGERKMLKRELDYNLDNAIFDAFPSPGAIVAADPYAIAYNLVQSSVSSYMNYRRAVAQLKIQHERKMWELEVEAMRELNGLNVELLNKQWKLVQAYKLDDYWRVSEEQIRELLARLNSEVSKEDSAELFNYLNSSFQRKKFQKLPAFWYYLGVEAEKQKQYDVAIDAYNRYQKEFYQVLRYDRMAASVAMNKTLLLLRKKADKKIIHEQLQIIENNVPDDWTFLYFCASIYFDTLGDKENANRLLDHAINLLQFQFSERLMQCRAQCKENHLKVEDHTIPNAMPLISCHVLKQRVNGYDNDPKQIKKIFAKFQNDSAKNCFGILSFYGRLPFEDIQTYVNHELRAIFIDYQYDSSFFGNSAPYRFVLHVPLSWYYAGKFDIQMKVTFADAKDPITVGLHPRYDDPNPVITDGEFVRYVFDCPSAIVRKSSPAEIELKFVHKFYPLKITFDASVLKNAVGKDKNNIRMYPQSAEYRGKAIPTK